MSPNEIHEGFIKTLEDESRSFLTHDILNFAPLDPKTYLFAGNFGCSEGVIVATDEYSGTKMEPSIMKG